MRRPVLLLVVLLAAALHAAPAPALTLNPLDGTYAEPTHIAAPPQDISRIFVVERAGVVRLIKGGVAQPAAEPFLDISALVDDTYGEEGLLSMAFAPDYATSRRFYIFYTGVVDGLDDAGGSDLVIEERRATADGDAAEDGYRAEVLRIDHRARRNHNGGQLQFGPDGNLWIGTGDGGGGFDPGGNAQNPSTLLGKLLRIAPRPGGGYDIPPGNPYATGGGAPEVWALGLRNPWRFSFDRATGDLMLGDVGQNDVEEINRAPAPGLGCGDNYGWVPFEGNTSTGRGTPPASHHGPLLTHAHTDGWVSITGGYVIRDPALAEAGSYVYGDFGRSELFTTPPASGAPQTTTRSVQGLSTFGEDSRGRVYASSYFDGRVYRLESNAGTNGDAGQAVTRQVPGCSGASTPPDPTPGDAAAEPASAPTQPLGARTGPLDRAPVLLAGLARRQRALRRGRVFVRAGCDVACRVSLAGRLSVGSRRITLVGSRANVAAKRRRTLLARLGPKARRAARRGLRRGARVRVALVLTGRTAAGATTRRTFRVTVVR